MRKRLAALLLIVSVLTVFAFPAYADDGDNFNLGATSLCVRVGETVQVKAYNGSMEAFGIVWSSNDETVAKVDSDGNVTGCSLGEAVITAVSSWGQTKQCVVHVAYKGIDVSVHQHTINWAAVKSAGIDFAMIRTGYGGEDWENQKDQCFEYNYTNAVQNGIKVGAYHYSYATSAAMAEQEANFCISVLNGRHLDYPVAYDVEDKTQYGLSTDTQGQIVQTFCSKLQQAGYKVAVYSYVNFYNAHLTSPQVSQYDTWIANTGVDTPSFSRPYTMWQYGTRSVSGISGACDVNYSYVDYSGDGGTGINGGGTSSMDPNLFECSIQDKYTFDGNTEYTYTIKTPDTMLPTCSSSNPSAVTVSYSGKTADGFAFKIHSVGKGQATITTMAANGRSVSFEAITNGAVTIPSSESSQPTTPSQPSQQPPTQPSNTLKSDTTAPYTFGGNRVYCYKITTSDTAAPTAVSSNPSAVSVSYYKKISDGYLYRITNAGKGTAVITTTAADGSSTSFTAHGTASKQDVVSDTPDRFTMKKGKTYQYKFTVPTGKNFSFSTGNNSVIKTVTAYKSGNDYFYKIQAVGKGCAGVYSTVAGGSPQRRCIVTVS